MSALSSRRGFASGLLAVLLLAGCTSQENGRESRSTAPASDTRLLGLWRVAAVYTSGEPTLHADQLTKASVDFRRDGRVITNGESCNAPRYTASDNTLTLANPKGGGTGTIMCSSATSGSDVALRVYSIVDRFTEPGRTPARSLIKYAVRGKGLTLTRGRSRLELRQGPAADQPASVSAAPTR